MSVDALLKLRDDIGETLSRHASDLKRQLSRLNGGSEARSAPGRRKRGGRRGKVAPKYRSAKGETWSGRGLKPRWLTAAIKEGKKPEDFLIGKRGRKKRAA